MTQTTSKARDRVIQSLLNRVSVYDDKLSESEDKQDLDQLKKIYIAQSNLLYRLEKLVVQLY